jgi:hypothetical protein
MIGSGPFFRLAEQDKKEDRMAASVVLPQALW